MSEASGCQTGTEPRLIGRPGGGHDTEEARNEGSHDHYQGKHDRFRRHPRAEPRRRAPGRHREHRQRGTTRLYLWCAPLPTTSTTLEQIDPGCIEPAGRREVFDFGDRKVGTTSPAQGFELGVFGNDPPPSTPRSASPATTPRPITAHRRCRALAGRQLPHHRHLHPHGHRAQARHPAHRTRGPDGGADRQGGHHPDPAGPAPDARRVRAGLRSSWGGGASSGHRPPRRQSATVTFSGARTTTPRSCSEATSRRPRSNFRPGKFSQEPTTIKARLKHLKQLRKEPTAPKIKIKFTATDEFGQRVTEERKVELCSRVINSDRALRSQSAGGTPHGNDLL